MLGDVTGRLLPVVYWNTKLLYTESVDCNVTTVIKQILY